MCDDPRVAAPTQAAAELGAAEASRPTLQLESRWPPAAALVVYMVFNIAMRLWLPGDSPVRVPWLIPATEAALLLVLLAADPNRLGRRTQWLHRVALTLVVLLVAAALWATALLVYDLVKGHGVTSSPSELLTALRGPIWG